MGKGAHLCLNGAFILSRLGPYMAMAEPGNCPREPFLIAPEGAQSRAVHGSTFFVVEEKGIFLNFKSLNAKFSP